MIIMGGLLYFVSLELLFNGIFIWVIIVFGSCGYWVEIGR